MYLRKPSPLRKRASAHGHAKGVSALRAEPGSHINTYATVWQRTVSATTRCSELAPLFLCCDLTANTRFFVGLTEREANHNAVS
ncbi:MAG: hypothetical protein BCS36_12730 [Desulfovibrio sp. MES5]|nr:MAG: hypothetical protein BCS36_12730 [Desulfovibrio sp. MES5]